MRNISEWKPTKVKRRGSQFSANPAGMAPGSLYITMEAFCALDAHASYLHGHLVDLGCGDVAYYEWYKDRVQKITCIDWPGSLHKAKHVDVFANLSQGLPLPTASVDCVLLTSVLEHIGEPQLLFKETRRILAKDGHLIPSVPFLYQLHEEPFDYYRYTQHGLEHLAKEAGLEVISMTHYGSAFGVLVDVSSKTTESAIGVICNFLPKRISVGIGLLGYKILRGFQQFCFFILKRRRVLEGLDRLNLSRRIPLGYVAVFAVKTCSSKSAFIQQNKNSQL